MTEKAIAKRDEFMLAPMAQAGAGFSPEDLADDYDGIKMTFPKVKIPSGGGIAWEVPNLADPDDPGSEKVLEGVILFHHAANIYWAERADDNGAATPPDCSAINGRVGIGFPGGNCAVCPMNEWGSGEGGKGKACKNMQRLYLLRSGEKLPLEITLPPTSLKSFDNFATSVFVRGRGLSGSVVQLSLKKMESANGKPYSQAVFKLARDFEGDELAAVLAFARDFRAGIKETFTTARGEE